MKSGAAKAKTTAPGPSASPAPACPDYVRAAKILREFLEAVIEIHGVCEARRVWESLHSRLR